MQKFYTMLTDIGMSKIMNAYINSSTVTVSHMAFGDSGNSYYEPIPTQTSLRNELYKSVTNNISIDGNNLIVDATIPTDIGGFYIREVGIFDTDGDMIIIGKHPETYKPMPNEGGSKELTIKLITGISEVSSINVDINTSMIFASLKDLDNLRQDVIKNTNDIAQLKEDGSNVINGDIKNSISRISHPTINAITDEPLQMEFVHNIMAGDKFNDIKLYEDNNPDVDLLTDRQVDTDLRVLKLIYPALTPNTNHTSEIPIEALKDRFGNVIKGAFKYTFLTRSLIQTTGGINNLSGRYVKDEGIYLDWVNPINVDLSGIKILRRSGSFPLNATDPLATVLQDNISQTFVDSTVVDGSEYFYKLFPYDSIGNINESETNQLQIKAKILSIIIITPNVSISNINTIIADAPANTNIIFTEGEYSITSPIIIDRSDISISGQGSITVFNADFIDSTKGVIDVQGTQLAPLENIRISNITIDGNQHTTKVSKGINLVYVGKCNTSITGKDINLKNGTRISNCIIKNCKGNGLELNNVSNSIISNTKCQNNNYGIYPVFSSNNNTITGNVMQNNNVGIYFHTLVNNNTIMDNIIQSNLNYGITFNSSSNNIISGNTIQNNGSNGINIHSSTNNIIVGNIVQNNTTHGIYLSSSANNINTITGNTVQNNGSVGIYLQSSSSTDNMIMSNIIQANLTNLSNSGTRTLLYGNKELT